MTQWNDNNDDDNNNDNDNDDGVGSTGQQIVIMFTKNTKIMYKKVIILPLKIEIVFLEVKTEEISQYTDTEKEREREVRERGERERCERGEREVRER